MVVSVYRIVLLVTVLVSLESSTAFTSISKPIGLKSASKVLFFSSGTPPPNSDSPDFPPEEDLSYSSSVDWDAEWKKVVRNKSQPIERPGKDFYKSEAEIAAIRAANLAARQAQNAASNLPSWRSLKGDWKVSHSMFDLKWSLAVR